jgi:cyclohexadienyl dehydratase
VSRAAAAASVFRLMDERMRLMSAVAAWKWLQRKPLRDRDRERTVLERVMLDASALGLSPAPIKRVFELQILCAWRLQARLHRDWQAHGFRFAGAVVSLEHELRPQLDDLSDRLLLQMHAALPVLSHPHFIQEWDGRAASLLSVGWSGRSRRQLMLALATVRARLAVTGTTAPVVPVR